MPRPRSDAGSLRAFSPEVLARAAGLRWEVPERSIERLIELLTNLALTTDPVPAEILRRSTLARHPARADLSRRVLRAEPSGFRRFEKERPNLLWLSDGMDGPYLPDPPRRRAQAPGAPSGVARRPQPLRPQRAVELGRDPALRVTQFRAPGARDAFRRVPTSRG